MVTIAKQVEQNKDIEYWYCRCGYRVTNIAYFSTKADLPCTCGRKWSNFMPRLKKEQ